MTTCVQPVVSLHGRAFVTAFRYMKQRIFTFMALPFEGLERASLTAKLREIGHAKGASSPRANVA